VTDHHLGRGPMYPRTTSKKQSCKRGVDKGGGPGPRKKEAKRIKKRRKAENENSFFVGKELRGEVGGTETPIQRALLRG